MANGDNDFEWAVKNGDLDMVKTFLAKVRPSILK